MRSVQPDNPPSARRRITGPSGIAVALLLLLVLMALAVAGCGSKAEDSNNSEPAQSETSTQDTTASDSTAPTSTGSQATPTPASGLQIEDKVVGSGAEAKPGDVVMVHYTGWLADGTQFDSSRDSGQPFQFTLGAGEVIPGWDQGVAGMKVGGVRKLTIPPELGYGPQGYPPVIPPNATLVFEIELLQVS